MHTEKSDLAGKEVKIKLSVKHPQNSNFGGSTFKVEDWWDHLTGKSWKDTPGNPACFFYIMRTTISRGPIDDDVLYGHTPDGLGHLVHITEIEE